jgi:hypothetical protein
MPKRPMPQALELDGKMQGKLELGMVQSPPDTWTCFSCSTAGERQYEVGVKLSDLSCRSISRRTNACCDRILPSSGALRVPALIPWLVRRHPT